LETIERDYSARGVKFYYIYKALAHPEMNGYVAPFSLEERLLHVAEAKKKLGSRITWLCDSMANDLKHALGDAPNSEFVIGPDGRVLQARRWSSPEQLRKDLAKLVGEVMPATTIDQVGMSPLGPPKTAAKGLVPRLQVPGRMMPVKVQPVVPSGSADSDPFYVKLRAEVDQSYAEQGEGKLYLGFFLDPLYKVHWNNRTAPLEYEIESPSSLTVEPATGNGPEVKEDADADPREFLIDVKGRSDSAIRVTVKYFACDDAETFCKPVTQQYIITLERDRDGGSRRSPGGRAATGTQRPGGGIDREMMPRMMARIPLIRALDANSDGEISQAEMENAVARLKRLDRDGDGQLTPEELRPRMNLQQNPARNQMRRNRGG
jgi:hypothetical protein